jgi:hypothetical protein
VVIKDSARVTLTIEGVLDDRVFKEMRALLMTRNQINYEWRKQERDKYDSDYKRHEMETERTRELEEETRRKEARRQELLELFGDGPYTDERMRAFEEEVEEAEEELDYLSDDGGQEHKRQKHTIEQTASDRLQTLQRRIDGFNVRPP